MKKTTLFAFVLLISLLPGMTYSAIARDQGDGPYLWYNNDGSVRLVQMMPDGELIDTVYTTLPGKYSVHVCSSDGQITFDVPLHEIARPEWKTAQPDSLFVLSDPHGRLDLLTELLINNGIIDESYSWSFGRNQMIIIGDVFDRGPDVTQILWLIYKLEKEASQAGGKVHFIYGNHETMVLAGDTRYTDSKYAELADTLGTEIADLYGIDTELGRWLGSRNTMEIIGNDLFVHAGISEEFIRRNPDIPSLNMEVSRTLFMTKKERKAESDFTAFLYGNEGPIWHRGLVRNKAKYYPTDKGILNSYLDNQGIAHIMVGHTIFKNIRSFYKGKVIAVNVDNYENHRHKRGRAVMICGKHYKIVDDNGNTKKEAHITASLLPFVKV